MATVPWFPQTYAEARQRFREMLAQVQAYWPQARLESHPLREHPDLSIDWIWADATQTPRNRVILTTGEHGIEGYVGSAMLALFAEEFLPRLDPSETGLLLVHVINPWGMEHRRRVNAQNVDLNRNFLSPEEWATVREVNPAYARMVEVLQPVGPIQVYGREKRRWFLRLARALLSQGVGGLKTATLLGQYRFPRGVYYGGHEVQEEVAVMMDLYRRAWAGYAQVVHLDMHTGYGPRGQLTIVNSPLEKQPLADFKARFDYPHIVATEPGTFYAIHGDMIDWVYRVAAEEAPTTQVYATTFEFGTLGESIPALIRSLRALVFENRAFWYGASEAARRQIAAEFTELFYPQETQWQQQAIRQAQQAFTGVLRAFRLLPS